MKPTDETRSKQQAINLRATRWAYAQEGLHVTTKAVLITFAVHANERGYTWPSVDRIASTWGMDRETVRRQIETLLVRRMICRTKKRCGSTGQVRVYRLPKITYESRGISTGLQNDQTGDKAGDKRGISGGKSAPNIGIAEQRKNHDDTRAYARTHAIPATQSANGESIESDENFLEEAEKHPLWNEFTTYCESQGGTPSVNGFFNTWLPKQSKERVAQAFACNRDKILAQRRDLVSRYSNGAVTTDERVHAFRRFAPPEVQEEYAALGKRLHR